MVREVEAREVTNTVSRLFKAASYFIGEDVMKALERSREQETSPVGKVVLGQIIENNQIAARDEVAICQDTGMAVLFIDLGQEVRITGGDFYEALSEGVRQAYVGGYLRKSVVDDPLYSRKNTRDNTPPVVHLRIVPGDRIHVVAAPKGFGSENMSGIRMLSPSDGVAGVESFVLETVKKAGPNPCPPIVVGVGIGGTIEKAAEIAKRATIREIGSSNPDPRYAALERRLLELVNSTGIGPGGLGGRITALAVHVEHYPTHIASLPVAVNIMCHAARHASQVI